MLPAVSPLDLREGLSRGRFRLLCDARAVVPSDSYRRKKPFDCCDVRAGAIDLSIVTTTLPVTLSPDYVEEFADVASAPEGGREEH